MMGYNVAVAADLPVGRSIRQLHFLTDVDEWNAVIVYILVKTRVKGRGVPLVDIFLTVLREVRDIYAMERKPTRSVYKRRMAS